MKSKEQIKSEIAKLQESLNKIEEQEKIELDRNKYKPIYTKIPELNIKISQQIYNGKTYSEILKLVKEEQIATYEILQKCRNLDLNKYPQFKDFLAFVPNPDKISKDNNYVTSFDANSNWADLYCSWDPNCGSPSLGVILFRSLK
jgi:hypothetical protein